MSILDKIKNNPIALLHICGTIVVLVVLSMLIAETAESHYSPFRTAVCIIVLVYLILVTLYSTFQYAVKPLIAPANQRIQVGPVITANDKGQVVLRSNPAQQAAAAVGQLVPSRLVAGQPALVPAPAVRRPTGAAAPVVTNFVNPAFRQRQQQQQAPRPALAQRPQAPTPQFHTPTLSYLPASGSGDSQYITPPDW